MSAIVAIHDLNHYYGSGELRKQILFDITLTLNAGEVVLLKGPSGSGKTTLLTLMGALRSCQTGSLQVLGQELVNAPKAKLVNIRRNIGYIFQGHNLLHSLTARQNVQMSAELQPLRSAVAKQRSEQMLTAVGLADHIDYYPAQMSGGQKQRVAIARALVSHPKMILADEPTAALDSKSGRAVVELIQQLSKEQGCASLIVTHDNRILDVADRLVHLEDGRLTEINTSATLVSS
ncbi:DevA family ABC transporter ATP-binding protein [Spirulina major CS-329]|uniref:DevA family ABC transporter ATP-binding protein n=1 Tax=Spirulina TaxID=1154 RepID=UPI00232C0646|nr:MULTISPECIES: DevA family ABC transporter ATP-binding protein [Spirulina]MDB9493865.1 DevA family ABC transporter ATP-binding protein [Spirulina subsalsa CS-330]MDB9502846.1 DevA family ABC transporter ATP-binding protein [Spirulina major CS-329]